MNAEKRSNTYLAIAFALGCFWGGVFVWIQPKAAIWVGMAVVIIVYGTLSFIGNTSNAN